MAVTIRLQRQGAKKKPDYAIVAMHHRDKRNGQYLERLGQYFPKAKDAKDKVKVNLERIQAWRAQGATISETVRNLLRGISN